MNTVNKTENKATLVTAIYNHSPKEILGGRGWSFDFYAPPFLNILKIGLPIIIYTHDRIVDDLSAFMKKHCTTNHKIILYDLNNFSYTNQILELKNSTGNFIDGQLKDDISTVSNDRNQILCLSKLYWLYKTAKTNPYNSDNFFWIDAGLFHHGIFPEKFGGRERFSRQENYAELYYPENKMNICNPQMGRFLSNFKDKFLTIVNQGMPINAQMKQLLDPDNKSVGYVVGGLLGGNADIIKNVLSDFDDGLIKCLENRILTLEEDLLSCTSSNHPDLYDRFYFSSWYHDIPNEPCSLDVDTSTKCFYKIFKDQFKI